MYLVFKLTLSAVILAVGVPDVPLLYQFTCECHGEVRGTLVNWVGGVFTPINSVTEAQKSFESWIDTSPFGPLLKARKDDPTASRVGPALCHKVR
jgi:hypothetical protein